jgi:hypothetical protein
VRRMDPFRFGRDKIFAVQIQMDMEAIRYGLWDSARDPMDMSRQIRLVAHELAHKCEYEIAKQILNPEFAHAY